MKYEKVKHKLRTKKNHKVEGGIKNAEEGTL
jgi:hypothetical protein